MSFNTRTKWKRLLTQLPAFFYGLCTSQIKNQSGYIMYTIFSSTELELSGFYVQQPSEKYKKNKLFLFIYFFLQKKKVNLTTTTTHNKNEKFSDTDKVCGWVSRGFQLRNGNLSYIRRWKLSKVTKSKLFAVASLKIRDLRCSKVL